MIVGTAQPAPISHTGEIAALAGVIVAVAILILAIGLFRRVGTIRAKLGSIELTAESVRKIDDVHARVDELTGAVAEVAQSVNGVGPEELKLIDKVRRLQVDSAWVIEHQHWMRRSLILIAAHVGARLDPPPSTRPPHVDTALPPPPPTRSETPT